MASLPASPVSGNNDGHKSCSIYIGLASAGHGVWHIQAGRYSADNEAGKGLEVHHVLLWMPYNQASPGASRGICAKCRVVYSTVSLE